MFIYNKKKTILLFLKLKYAQKYLSYFSSSLTGCFKSHYTKLNPHNLVFNNILSEMTCFNILNIKSSMKII
jgi:hypothetical protein